MIKDKFLTKYLKKNSYRVYNAVRLISKTQYKNNFFYFQSKKKNKKLNSNYINTIKTFELLLPHTFNFSNSKINYLIRKFKIKDKKQILDICENSYPISRFTKDVNISNKFKKTYLSLWLRNYFLGKRGDDLIVAETKKGKIAGFCLVLISGSNIQIDQIIVKKEQRNKGIAKQLIKYLTLLKNFKKIIAGTDSTNKSAVTLYKKLGFKLKKFYYNYHFHS